MREAAEKKKNEFLNFIKNQKVVFFEDLAGHFQMTTKEVLDKISELEAEHLLNGVVDDRGKYICITEQEMDKCKKFIMEKGRISKAELLVEWSRIISLEPKKASPNIFGQMMGLNGREEKETRANG